jgi:hypothetical protein
MMADTAEKTSEPDPLHASINDATGSCELCDSWETQEMAGRWLCATCIAVAGCGCAGSTVDDDK